MQGDGEGGGWDDGGHKWRYRKLELPIFEGTNPDGWVLRMERYFRFIQLEATEKVEATVVALEGDALLWFQFEDNQKPITRWDEFKRLILRQFRSREGGSLAGSGEYQDYCCRFIELLAPFKGIPDDVAMGQFIQGLT